MLTSALSIKWPSLASTKRWKWRSAPTKDDEANRTPVSASTANAPEITRDCHHTAQIKKLTLIKMTKEVLHTATVTRDD